MTEDCACLRDFAPRDFKSASQADDFMSKVDSIREKVKVGKGAAGKGDCDSALTAFNAVLKMNPKIADAKSGVAACRAGTIPGRME